MSYLIKYNKISLFFVFSRVYCVYKHDIFYIYFNLSDFTFLFYDFHVYEFSTHPFPVRPPTTAPAIVLNSF